MNAGTQATSVITVIMMMMMVIMMIIIMTCQHISARWKHIMMIRGGNVIFNPCWIMKSCPYEALWVEFVVIFPAVDVIDVY